MKTMKIAVIGDLHYPALAEEYAFIKEDRKKFYANFMERFFSIPADLYVSIGDLTNYGLKEELEEIYAIIDQHQKPFVQVLGNHDLYGQTRHEVLTITQQKRYRDISTDQAVLAFLDTAKEQDYRDCGGALDPAQLYWLKGVVEQSGSRPLIVFGHHPVYDTTIQSDQEFRCIHPRTPVWDVLNKKQGPGLYMNGHNHCNSIAVREQWNFVQLAAVLDEQTARIIDLSDTEISIETIDLYDPELQKCAQVIGHTIPYFSLNRQLLGPDSDVKHVIPLPVRKAQRV